MRFQLLFNRLNAIPKKRRFIISTLFLTLFMLASSFFSVSQALIFTAILIILVYIFSYFSILEGIDEHERLMLFVHPIYFSLVLYLFYFLLPGRWLTRAPYILVYSVSIYAIMLSSNIFNVGAVKNLQLFRAAFSVNFLFLAVTTFLTSSLILSLKLNYLLNSILIFVTMIPLTLQFFWSVDPKSRVERRVLKYAIANAFVIGQIALIFSFIPIRSNIFALVITAVFYSLAGFFHAYMENMLYRERIREYALVLFFVLLIALLSVRWG